MKITVPELKNETVNMRIFKSKGGRGSAAPAEALSGEAPAKIWNRTFISVFTANMILNFAMQMSNSIIGKYTRTFDVATAVIGLVTSLFGLTALIFKFFSAPAIDTGNRKWILTIAMLVIAAAMCGYSISFGVPMLVAFRLLQGAGQAFTATCALTVASDTLPPEKMGTGIGYFMMTGAISQTIAPTVSLKLADAIGFRATFAMAGGLMLIGAFAASRIDLPFVRTKKFKVSLKNMIAMEAVIPALILCCLSIAFYNISSFLAIYGDVKGVGSNIGYYFTVYAVTMIFTRPLTGRLSDKFGPIKVMLPAMGCFAFSFFIISFASNMWMFLFAAFVAAFGFGSCQPQIQALCMRLVPKERRGAASCTNYIGSDIGMLIGPVIAGYLVDYLGGYEIMWRIMTIPIAIAAIMLLVFRKRLINTVSP